ncbi:MAG: sugar-specific transcriptional regulator TrmB [Oceanicoccus sp.]|jgi:sugar-specific transcriptional regulator TrmB
MQNIETILRKIGLSDLETRIYLKLLEEGEQAASPIARDLKIPRNTTRGILDKLCERQLSGKIYRRNTQFYQVKNPISILGILAEEREKINEAEGSLKSVMPLLLGLHEQKNIVPKIRFYEKENEIIEAFNHSLYAGVKEILTFTSYEFFKSKALRDNDVNFYIPMRVKKEISMKVLVGKTNFQEKLIPNEAGQLRERRFLPEDLVLPGNFMIYGDFVFYFSSTEKEQMAIQIESRIMAETLRVLFMFIWNTSSVLTKVKNSGKIQIDLVKVDTCSTQSTSPTTFTRTC